MVKQDIVSGSDHRGWGRWRGW